MSIGSFDIVHAFNSILTYVIAHSFPINLQFDLFHWNVNRRSAELHVCAVFHGVGSDLFRACIHILIMCDLIGYTAYFDWNSYLEIILIIIWSEMLLEMRHILQYVVIL